MATQEDHVDYAGGQNNGAYGGNFKKAESGQSPGDQDALGEDICGSADEGHCSTQQGGVRQGDEQFGHGNIGLPGDTDHSRHQHGYGAHIIHEGR